MKKITILDYGVGNIESLKLFFKSIGYESLLTNKKNIIENSDIVVLPGIGAFPIAIKNMKKNGLFDSIIQFSKTDKPIIGICLGMQLLATKSFEFEETEGLNLIPGEILPINKNEYQIGWSQIITNRIDERLWYSPDDTFYFNHSYYYKGSKNLVNACTDNKAKFPAIIVNRNIFGIQFHPEKSQESGKNLMINLLNTFK